MGDRDRFFEKLQSGSRKKKPQPSIVN